MPALKLPKTFSRSQLPLAVFVVAFAAVGSYLLIHSFAASPNTYYIDYATGSDSNSGTSKTSPWKEAPGMQGFTGAYSHQAGDHFIFKGGVTWPNSVFPLTVVGSGTGSASDYYGTDQTWYAGGSFSRPVFDAQNENIDSGVKDIFFDLRGHDDVTIDDISFLNWTATGITGGYGSCAVVELSGDSSITINRILVSGMSIDATGNSNTCAVAFGSTQSPYAGNSMLENSTITGNNDTYGFGAWAIGNVENNTISGIPSMVYPAGHGTISGNLLYDCGSPSFPAGATNLHADAIQSIAADGTFYIHDNVIHDTGSSGSNECESIFLGNAGETDYVWNNVLYNLNGESPAETQNTAAGNAAYFWDNTIYAGGNGSESCIRKGHADPPTYVVQNNLCISSAGSTVQSTITTTTNSNNVLLTPAQASSDVSSGLLSTSPYEYAPTGSGSPGVGAGVNLSSNCSAALSSLCFDTTYADTRTPLAQPNVGGWSTWNAGAFEGNTTLNPGNGLSTSPSYFPIMVWYQGTLNAATYKSIGVNMFEEPDAYSSTQLATLKSAGINVIECSANGNPGSSYLGADGTTYPLYTPLTCPHDNRGDPSENIVKGWFDIPDESDTAQGISSSNYGPCFAPSALQNETNAIKSGDDVSPNRPIVMNFNGGVAFDTTARGSFCHYHTDYYAQYMQAANIATFDTYPVNYGHPLDSNAVGTSNLHTWLTGVGQDKTVIPIIETTPIHTGAAGPTPAQLHFEIWNSIIAGANGIGYFCDIITPSFNEAGCLSIANIKVQMSADDAQIQSLAPVLNTNTVTPAVTASASFKVDMMTKRSGGQVYAFTDADDASGGNVTFTDPDSGNGTVTVLGENRTIPLVNGSFTDSFSSYGVHLYEISNGTSSSGGGGGSGAAGDLNSDSHVNIVDLSIFLSHWQQTGTGLPEDFNSDNVVNIVDLSILLSHYGT